MGHRPHWKSGTTDPILDLSNRLKFRSAVLSQPPPVAPNHPVRDPASQDPAITIYTSATCGYCAAAKNFLKSRLLEWREVRIDLDAAARERMVALAHRTSVPQIFIGETHVGGYDDMIALHRAGKLDAILVGAAA